MIWGVLCSEGGPFGAAELVVMGLDRIEEEVARLFWERMDFVLGGPGAMLRMANGNGPGFDVLLRKREEWGRYLDGLAVYGVRRQGFLSFLEFGIGPDEIALDDSLSGSGVIIVPREFGFRMVVLGELP